MCELLFSVENNGIAMIMQQLVTRSALPSSVNSKVEDSQWESRIETAEKNILRIRCSAVAQCWERE
jgi:hypothetical protein